MPEPVLVPVVFRKADSGIDVLLRQTGDGPVHFPTFLPDPGADPIGAARQAIAPLITMIRPGQPERLGLLPIGDPEVWDVVLIPLTPKSKATLTDGEGMLWQPLTAETDGWAAPSRSLHEVLQGCASDLERLSLIEA
ncbi:hypothetical protein [Pseudooceanicola sp. MF1-13]|uniref:hypothetical protein n=1 Tax=Pseudooceanicola sp. MF1-13 TaxID=3379095 RepID=UPI0038923BA2